MNRTEMIERIVGILTPPHPLTADAAAALILDAVVPALPIDHGCDHEWCCTQCGAFAGESAA